MPGTAAMPPFRLFVSSHIPIPALALVNIAVNHNANGVRSVASRRRAAVLPSNLYSRVSGRWDTRAGVLGSGRLAGEWCGASPERQ